jgi:hypothetical protein
MPFTRTPGSIVQTELPGKSGEADDSNGIGNIRTTAQQFCLRDIAFSSLRISLVVGTVLNLINQGGYWLQGEGLHVGHFILNYSVPFCVAAYSAIRTRSKDIGAKGNPDEIC